MTISIWWIRRDLRLSDNATLQEAVAHSSHLLPLFILDPTLLAQKADKRKSFLFEALSHLDSELRAKGSRLIIKTGKPIDVLQSVMASSGASAIFAEADYSPYARSRDQAAAAVLPLWLVHGLTIFPPGMIVKNNGCPYTVFTPFYKAWRAMPLPSPEIRDAARLTLPPLPVGSVQSDPIPAFTSSPEFPATQQEALKRLKAFVNGPVYEYAENRDRMDLDGTSRLSPYLRFGLISAATTTQTAMHAVESAANPIARKNADVWLSELVWREFYISILHHFPEVLHMSFRKDLVNISWRNVPSELEAWKTGLTGYPVVDAGMRQMAKTGWMHNRARMIAASFLVKDLLINWQEGESWFMQHLLDGDPASNNGGWQWSSGVGTDAAPYFRIFNPVLQGEKYDPQGTYVRQWVPELAKVPTEYIHKPWTMPEPMQRELGVMIGEQYPCAIVDHSKVKERTLAAYNTGSPRTVMEGCPQISQ